MLDVLRERITAMDDAILVQLNAAGSGDELSWAPLAAVTAAGLQAGNPDLRGRIIGALQWARHLIGSGPEPPRTPATRFPADPPGPGGRGDDRRDRRDRQH